VLRAIEKKLWLRRNQIGRVCTASKPQGQRRHYLGRVKDKLGHILSANKYHAGVENQRNLGMETAEIESGGAGSGKDHLGRRKEEKKTPFRSS